MVSGVYILTCKVCGLRYVGGTSDLKYGVRNLRSKAIRGRKIGRLGEHVRFHGREWTFDQQTVVICDKHNIRMYEQMVYDYIHPELNTYPPVSVTVGMTPAERGIYYRVRRNGTPVTPA